MENGRPWRTILEVSTFSDHSDSVSQIFRVPWQGFRQQLDGLAIVMSIFGAAGLAPCAPFWRILLEGFTRQRAPFDMDASMAGRKWSLATDGVWPERVITHES
jgi:hypothetical protein